jgi:hypothetical protein
MAIMITDREMTSDQTRHTARTSDDGGWVVTWLPGRVLTHSQAITALTIAEVLGVQDGLLHCDNPMWLHIDNWAAELGIGGPYAVAEASLSPEDHAMLA